MSVVSIVIPTWNRRHLLPETIATVRDQTFDEWELIVVDEASTDGTQEFLRTLPDPRIRTIRRASQGGVSIARNDGLAEARGEFVMFLDDDDLLRPGTLAKMVNALRAQLDAVGVFAACRLFREDGDSSRVYRPAKAYTRMIWREILFGWWSNSGQNVFRTSVVRELGGFDRAFRNCQDRKLNLGVAWRGPICVLPFVAMEYRQHAAQMSKWQGVAEQREAVWRGFIGSLPPSRQAEGRRIRRAAELVERSERARAAGEFGAALRMQLHACALAPALVASPLTARPLWWGVKKCLHRVYTP